MHDIKHIRQFRHLASNDSKHDAPPAISPTTKPSATPPPNLSTSPSAASAKDVGGTPVHVTQAEQRRTDLKIVKQLLVNIWPKGQWDVKTRVVAAVGLLLVGKVRLEECFAVI